MSKSFDEIRKIDVNGKIEKKGNLSYLSWAWAWDEMKRIDPKAKVVVHEYVDNDLVIALAQTQTITSELIEILPKKQYRVDPKVGVVVTVTVTMNDISETETLPVMNYKNQAILNPNAMDINKTIKRCFVKALALHGLGLYIYAGEDLPTDDNDENNDNKGNKSNKGNNKKNQKQENIDFLSEKLKAFEKFGIEKTTMVAGINMRLQDDAFTAPIKNVVDVTNLWLAELEVQNGK